MNLINKVGKLARQTIVSDEAVSKVIAPIIDKTSDAVGKAVENNIRVPDVIGIKRKRARKILDSLGFKTTVLYIKIPNKKYAHFKINEIVEMKYDKPNPILKGIPKGSLIKLYTIDEEILRKSKSWLCKLKTN